MSMTKDTNPAIVVALHLLLDHHGAGIEEAHPNYIREKLEEFEGMTFAEAWAKLDYRNHGRLLDWLDRWNIPYDPTFSDYYKQELEAATKLGL